jgi:hypothetical protein
MAARRITLVAATCIYIHPSTWEAFFVPDNWTIIDDVQSIMLA